MLALLRVGLIGSTLLLGMLGMYLHGYFLIPCGIGAAVTIVSFLFGRKGRQKQISRTHNKGITEAQIDTLLKLTGNNLTIKKVADATKTSNDTAKKCLDNLVLQNKLSVHAGETELIYKREELPD